MHTLPSPSLLLKKKPTLVSDSDQLRFKSFLMRAWITDHKLQLGILLKNFRKFTFDCGKDFKIFELNSLHNTHSCKFPRIKIKCDCNTNAENSTKHSKDNHQNVQDMRAFRRAVWTIYNDAKGYIILIKTIYSPESKV